MVSSSRSFRRMRSLALSVAVAVLVASGAQAAPSSADRQAARQLFDQAYALERAERWSEAIPMLAAALERVQTPGLEYHLAYCLEQSGDLASALEHYERARVLIEGGAKAPDVEQLLGPRRSALLERVPSLTVQAPSSGAVRRFLIDEKEQPLDVLGRAVRLNPGAHRIRLEGSERSQIVQHELSLPEGRHETWQASWPALAAPPVSRPVQQRSPEPRAERAARGGGGLTTRTLVLIAEGTLAVAGAGLGLGFTLAANAEDDTQQRLTRDLRDGAARNDTRYPCAELWAGNREECGTIADSARAEQRKRDLALASFVGGGVMALATAGTWLLWKPEADSRAAGLRFDVRPARGGLAWTASGRF